MVMPLTPVMLTLFSAHEEDRCAAESTSPQLAGQQRGSEAPNEGLADWQLRAKQPHMCP